MRRKLLLLIAAFLVGQAQAATIEQPLVNVQQEQEARDIFHGLRCMVCEGQSLAESDAVLAVQMRAHVRTMVEAGKTPQEIYAFFRTSYGERILMTPPMENRTFMLWAAPFAFLLIGAATLWRLTKRKESLLP